MNRFDHALSTEGIRFLGSRHDDNIAQAIVAHSKAKADPVETERHVRKNLQRWWPKRQRPCATAAHAMYLAFGHLVDQPDMASAVFHKMGENTQMPNPYPDVYDKDPIVVGKPEHLR
ncbi:hypothetical protein AB4379_12215 [Vibrio breoganii]